MTRKPTIQQQIPHNLALIHNLRMRPLTLNKILQKVRLPLIEILILPLHPRHHVLHRNIRHIRNIRRTKRVHGVLVKDIIRPGHLSAQGQVINRLVGRRQGAIKVASLGHIPELGAEGDGAQEIPRIEAKPFAELAGEGGGDVAGAEVGEEVEDYAVHVRFHCENGGDGVVPDDGAFEAGVLGVGGFAEHVVGYFAVDDGGGVFVEVGLGGVGVSMGVLVVDGEEFTLTHFPSVLYMMRESSG